MELLFYFLFRWRCVINCQKNWDEMDFAHLSTHDMFYQTPVKKWLFFHMRKIQYDSSALLLANRHRWPLVATNLVMIQCHWRIRVEEFALVFLPEIRMSDKTIVWEKTRSKLGMKFCMLWKWMNSIECSRRISVISMQDGDLK